MEETSSDTSSVREDFNDDFVRSCNGTMYLDFLESWLHDPWRVLTRRGSRKEGFLGWKKRREVRVREQKSSETWTLEEREHELKDWEAKGSWLSNYRLCYQYYHGFEQKFVVQFLLFKIINKIISILLNCLE